MRAALYLDGVRFRESSLYDVGWTRVSRSQGFGVRMRVALYLTGGHKPVRAQANCWPLAGVGRARVALPSGGDACGGMFA